MTKNYPLYILGIFLYIIYFVFAGIGDRVGNVGISTGILRSIHLSDLFFPFLLLVALRNSGLIEQILGKRLFLVSILWSYYCITFGTTGHLLTGLALEGKGVVAGVAFAIKEIEFISFLWLAAYIGYLSPTASRRTGIVLMVALSVWLFKELLIPSGYYLVGLPFEKGAPQTGTIYAFMLLSGWFYLSKNALVNDVNNKSRFKYVLPILIVTLFIGVVASLSRSSILGMFVALLVAMYMSRRSVFRNGKLLILIIGITSLFLTSKYAEVFTLSIDRWSDVSEHAMYRIEKWTLLVSYIMEHPSLIFFGAGLGSPNYLVLGEELGFMLTVDSGYIRRIFEVGIVGSILYYWLLYEIARRAISLKCERYLIPLITLFMAGAVTLEAFQVSQTALMFYGIAGTILGIVFRSRKEESFQQEIERMQYSIDIKHNVLNK